MSSETSRSSPGAIRRFSIPRCEDLSLLEIVFSVFNALGARIWLDQGTLLGVLRENRLLPQDADIDLGIWRTDWERSRRALSASLRSSGLDVAEEGHMVVVERPDTDQRPVQIALYVPAGEHARKTFRRRRHDSPARRMRLLIGAATGGLLTESLIRLSKVLRRRKQARFQRWGAALLTWTRKISRLRHRWLLRLRVVRLQERVTMQFAEVLCPIHHFRELEPITINEVPAWLPSQPEAYLCFKYGEDWLVPRLKWSYWADDGGVQHAQKVGVRDRRRSPVSGSSEQVQPGNEGERFDSPDLLSSARPLVSVVLPTFNRAHLLGRAIDSVLCQTYEELELIVVDDGSTDETQELLGACSDPRVKVLRLDGNYGGAYARNAGIEMANGSYVGFLDSDDEWLPNKLLRQVCAMESSEIRPGMVYTGIKFSLADGTQKSVIRRNRGHLFPHFAKDQHALNYRNSCCLWRRDVLEEIGGFDRDLRARQDWDLACRGLQVTTCDYVDEASTVIHTYINENRISRDQDARIAAGHYLLKSYEEMDLPHRRHLLAQLEAVLGKDYFVRGDRVDGRRHIVSAMAKAPSTTMRALWPGGLLATGASFNGWAFEQVLLRWKKRR